MVSVVYRFNFFYFWGFKLKKKAQGLSLNTIIIAVIVLIVLVVLIVIFSGKIGGFRKGLDNCDGTCESSAANCGSDKTPIFLINCDDDGDGKADGGNYCCTTQNG